MKEGVVNLIDTSFTLYKCSPLLHFASGRQPYHNVEDQLAKGLCDALDLVIESSTFGNQQRAKGRIYRLRLRPFELDGYAYDKTDNEQPPLKFEFEYQYYHEKKSSLQTMIMLPSKKNGGAQHSSTTTQAARTHFWYYPLILAKLSKTVFAEIKDVFESSFKAQITKFHMPQKMMRHAVICYAETFFESIPHADEYFGPIAKEDHRSVELRLEYQTDSAYARYISFSIAYTELRKMCRLSGDPESFVSCFEHHILKKTGINLVSLQLSSVSSAIGVVNVADKIKLHPRSSETDVYKIINALSNIASA